MREDRRACNWERRTGLLIHAVRPVAVGSAVGVAEILLMSNSGVMACAGRNRMAVARETPSLVDICPSRTNASHRAFESPSRISIAFALEVATVVTTPQLFR